MISPINLLEYAALVCSEEQASEVNLRAAVSRAYYGALHTAIAYCITNQLLEPEELKSSSSHASVIDSLTAADLELLSVAGTMLRTRKRIRVDADYNLDIEVSRRMAQEHVKKCQKIREKLLEAAKSKFDCRAK